MTENNNDDEKYVTYCNTCEKKLSLGDTIQYDKNYREYCQDFDCIDGISTQQTLLEECWFE